MPLEVDKIVEVKTMEGIGTITLGIKSQELPLKELLKEQEEQIGK